MTVTVDAPNLRELTLDQLTEVWCASGQAFQAEIEAEIDRREDAARRSDRARAAARARNAEWEAAAYAQYERVLAAGWSSGLLSDAGKRKEREPWPMLWQGNEQDARLLASDEVLRYWDHTEPRIPPPAQFRAAQRAAAAEQAARHAPAGPARPATRTPSARELAEHAAATAAPATPAPARPPGSIARYITALGILRREADKTARALARVNGGIQR